jgi:hypothetical protein
MSMSAGSAGRVASLDASELDAPFRACVAAGARILSGLSILVCTPSPYDPARFRHLWMTVRFLSGLGCRRVKVIVHTDTTEARDLKRLQDLVKPISDETIIQSEPNLRDLKDLPWRHKKVLWQDFLSDASPFDLFLYIEDDIFVTTENLAWFVAYRQAFDRFGFIPSFFRCEYNVAQQRLYSIDQVWPQPVLPHQHFRIGQITVVNSDFPFCAMYVFDRALAREHLGTRSAVRESSWQVEQWGDIEHASLGQMQENVRPGFRSRYLVPIDAETLAPLPACIVHHASDKYTNLDAEHGRVPLDGVFSRWP